MNPRKTKEFDCEDFEMNDQTCPTCGMDQKDWSRSKGYQQGGESYCCQGCAEGTGCTCAEEFEQSNSKPFKQSKKVA